MSRFTPWPYLLHCQPEEARRRILSAYKQAGGVHARAAKLLDLSTRQLGRYRTALRLMNEQLKADARPIPRKAER